MLGERGSIFQAVFLNPLVWIGLLLTFFTMEYNKEDVFGIFFVPETYRNLAIGSAIYVGLFGRKYTEGMNKLDWNQTLGGVIEAMLLVLGVWFFSLFAIIHYQRGGEAYSDLIRKRYQREGVSVQNTAPKNDVAVEEAMEKVNLQAGKKYKVTPHEDGSFTVEVE